MNKYISLLFVYLWVLPLHAIELEGTKWISVDETSKHENQWICFQKKIFVHELLTDGLPGLPKLIGKGW